MGIFTEVRVSHLRLVMGSEHSMTRTEMRSTLGSGRITSTMERVDSTTYNRSKLKVPSTGTTLAKSVTDGQVMKVYNELRFIIGEFS